MKDFPTKLEFVSPESINETSVAFNIRLPRVLDGISGFYEVYYTNGLHGHPDPSNWPKRVITPKDGKLSVSSGDEASVVLSELSPNQQYFLKIDLHVRKNDEEAILSSGIVSARTPEVETPAEPALPTTNIERLDVSLTTKEITASTAEVKWRFFSQTEKAFIDGVQLRFTELREDGEPATGVPATSPFIHRDTNFFLLENLKADTAYEVDLYLIPMPRATTEMVSERGIKIRTAQPSKGNLIS